MAILQHERWQEAMEVPSEEFMRPTKYLIELMPKAAKILLDNCIIRSERPSNDVNYVVRTSWILRRYVCDLSFIY